jgi:DNA polymerase delta, subunit 4
MKWAVHQEDLSTEEKILRLFDMSSQYGVRGSTSDAGISRTDFRIALHWNCSYETMGSG